MAKIENVDESLDVEDNTDEIEIPDGLPGSKNPNRPSAKNTRPEVIPVVKRSRGRPRNTATKTNSVPLATEKLWVEGAAIVLSTSSALFATRVMSDTKYVMTAAESRSAASGLIYLLFQYKQVREFAVMVRTDSPTAIVLKGFWPYLSRVFVKDFIENVIAGFAIPRQQQKPEQSKSQSNGAKSDSGNDVGAIAGQISWRDI